MKLAQNIREDVSVILLWHHYVTLRDESNELHVIQVLQLFVLFFILVHVHFIIFQ